jgi:hypothetical protein
VLKALACNAATHTSQTMPRGSFSHPASRICHSTQEAGMRRQLLGPDDRSGSPA